MSKHVVLSLIPGVLVAATVALPMAAAGPINPPAGPVAPTPGPEPRTAINDTNTAGDADSLFKITAPGSYYLTGNITGVVGKHGIEIVSSGVTLDLNGFELAGIPGMGAFDGVSVTTVAGLKAVSVINGTVRNWGDQGIDLKSGQAHSCRVERVSAYGNATDGIASETVSLIIACMAHGNGGRGIVAGDGSSVQGCATYFNTGSGIYVSSGVTVSHCTAYDNSGDGFVLFSGSTITNCTARLNSGDGIQVGSGCIVQGSTCAGNGIADGAGIHVTGGDNRIEGNNCTGADRGIDVDAAGNIIIRNSCSGNTTNWTIAAGNSIGAIVTAGTLSAAISTNGAVAGTMGTTDPNANFNY